MSNNKVMRDNWKGTGSATPVAMALNKAGRSLNGIRMEGGGNVQKFGNNIVIPRAISAGISFSKFCFGFRKSGTTVTIVGGDWPIGEAAPLELPDTDVTISQDGQYVGLEVDTIAKTITVIGPSVNKAFFNPDAQKFRCWLHQFNFSGGTVSLKRTRLGSLFMPATFGAAP
jgi:hypothetical protein